MRGLAIQDTAFLGEILDPVVRNYRDVVLPGNPVSTPLSATELVALNSLVLGCRADGIWSKMIEFNPFLGAQGADTTTALKPLILGPDGATNGAFSWTGGGIASVSVNGALGSGTGGSLMGLRPSNAYPSANSAGITLYVSTMTAAGLIIDCGAFSGLQAASLLCNYDLGAGAITQGLIWDSAGGAGAGDNLVKTPASGLAGFYSMSRTAANVAKLYFANSTNAFAEIATTASNNQTWFNGVQMMMFAANNGAAFFPSVRRYSFAAWHAGLTLIETQALFNRVQAFRQSVGGGFL